MASENCYWEQKKKHSSLSTEEVLLITLTLLYCLSNEKRAKKKIRAHKEILCYWDFYRIVRPLRSCSPTISPSLPCPLNHVPNGCVKKAIIPAQYKDDLKVTSLWEVAHMWLLWMKAVVIQLYRLVSPEQHPDVRS